MDKGNDKNVSVLWKILNLELWKNIFIEKQELIKHLN